MDSSSSKISIIEEERAALDTPLDAGIHTAKLQAETQEELNAEARALYAAHMDVFSTYEEAEYFAMLPLSKANRKQVMGRALELIKEEREAKQAWPVAPVSER